MNESDLTSNLNDYEKTGINFDDANEKNQAAEQSFTNLEHGESEAKAQSSASPNVLFLESDSSTDEGI